MEPTGVEVPDAFVAGLRKVSDMSPSNRMSQRVKISVIGAGMVGGAVAQYLALRDYADIVLVDIVEGLPQGKALDLAETAPVLGYDSALVGANSLEATKESDIIVITSGVARKPGMSRDDLLRTNMGIVRSVTREVVQH